MVLVFWFLPFSLRLWCVFVFVFLILILLLFLLVLAAQDRVVHPGAEVPGWVLSQPSSLRVRKRC